LRNVQEHVETVKNTKTVQNNGFFSEILLNIYNLVFEFEFPLQTAGFIENQVCMGKKNHAD